MTIIEKLSLGFTVAGIGIAGVFCILVLLILSIKLMGVIIASAKKSKTSANETQPLPKVQEVEMPITSTSDNDLIAVITGAVAMMLAEGNSGNEKPNFIIKKIKKIKR